MGRAPDFLGLGAQRAGTSWLYGCLYEHPRICAPRKEIHFFSRERNWKKGFEWYESLFEECSSHQRAGEISTSYLHHPDTPRRIHGRYPDVRLIVLLRNPVERAFSSFRNDVMAGEVPAATSFEEALRERPRYVEAGRYAVHLERYLRRFDRKRMAIFLYESIREDPDGLLRTLFEFLEVDPSFQPSLRDTRVNPGREPRVPGLDATLNRLAGWFRASPLTRPAWWLAKRTGLGRGLRWLNTASGPDRRLEPATRRMLHQAFEGDIARLEEMLDRSLDAWRRANRRDSP